MNYTKIVCLLFYICIIVISGMICTCLSPSNNISITQGDLKIDSSLKKRYIITFKPKDQSPNKRDDKIDIVKRYIRIGDYELHPRSCSSNLGWELNDV